jgi:hypothetical protein
MKDEMKMSEPMEPEKTVLEQYPEVYGRFKKPWPSIYKLSTLLCDEEKLDLIVSKSHGATKHWHNGQDASSITNRRAKAYLDNLENPNLSQPTLELIPMGKPGPKPAVAPETLTFMVEVPADYMDKWQTFADIFKGKGCKIAAF